MRPTIDSRLQLAAIVLAEELRYGRAAQKLHIAVSTLSKQIALLEEKLGFILFVRNSKTVELTEAGRASVEEARASLHHPEKAVDVARAANDGLVAAISKRIRVHNVPREQAIVSMIFRDWTNFAPSPWRRRHAVLSDVPSACTAPSYLDPDLHSPEARIGTSPHLCPE